jgi:hypothetical protein
VGYFIMLIITLHFPGGISRAWEGFNTETYIKNQS